MAQLNVRDLDAATYVGIEAVTFGTLATPMVRVFPHDRVEPRLSQTEIETMDESPLLFDYKTPVFGLKSEDTGFKLPFHLRPHATQLDTAAGVLTTPPNQITLNGLLGGEQISAGSIVAVSTSATVFTVDTGHGSRFKPMTPVLVERTAGVLEIAVIESVAGDVLTLRFALSGAPFLTGKVVNLMHWYPTPGNTYSLSAQHAKATGGGAAQWQVVGLTGDVKLVWERNAILGYEADLKGADWSDGSLGVSTAFAADAQAAHFAMAHGSLGVLQGRSSTTRAFVSIHKIEVTIKNGMVHIPEAAGSGVQGVVGVMRTGERPYAEVKLTFRYDRDLNTAWASRGLLQFGCFVPYGSGLTQRWASIYCPQAVIVGRPPETAEDGRILQEVTLRAQINTSGADDLARAPIIISVG